MDKIEIRKVNYRPIVELVESVKGNVRIIRGKDQYFYIEDGVDYYILMGQIEYTKENLTSIIKKYIDLKPSK